MTQGAPPTTAAQRCPAATLGYGMQPLRGKEQKNKNGR